MFEPVYPCRVMPTRACPASYEGVCGDRPCARFEADDEPVTAQAVWAVEIEETRERYAGRIAPPVPPEVYQAGREASRETQEVDDRIACAVEATWIRAWQIMGMR